MGSELTETAIRIAGGRLSCAVPVIHFTGLNRLMIGHATVPGSNHRTMFRRPHEAVALQPDRDHYRGRRVRRLACRVLSPGPEREIANSGPGARLGRSAMTPNSRVRHCIIGYLDGDVAPRRLPASGCRNHQRPFRPEGRKAARGSKKTVGWYRLAVARGKGPSAGIGWRWHGGK